MNYKENYTSIHQYILIHFNIERFKVIDFMVIESCFFKKRKKKKIMKNMDKIWKALFEILRMSYVTGQPIFIYFFHIKSEIIFKLKVKMWFSMGRP